MSDRFSWWWLFKLNLFEGQKGCLKEGGGYSTCTNRRIWASDTIPHVDWTVLSICQKAGAFDHNLNHYTKYFSLNLNTFLSAYRFLMKKYKINISVSLKIVELYTKTRLISNKWNRMLLTLVSPGCPAVISFSFNQLKSSLNIFNLIIELEHYFHSSKKHLGF